MLENSKPEERLIRKITFSDGATLELDSGSIVVFVGSNNVGKSQSLKDIYNLLLTDSEPSVLVRSTEIIKPDRESFENSLREHSMEERESGQCVYAGFDYRIYSSHLDAYESEPRLSFDTRNFYSAFVDTEKRLVICHQTAPRGRGMAKQNPIDYVAEDDECERRLTTSFFDAFGVHVQPDLLDGAGTPLMVGEPIDYATEQINTREIRRFREEMAKLKPAHEQGDGMRSFLGVMLYLMVEHLKVLFIDEPEAFLHPPQAGVIGRCIGENAAPNQQLFIATHSKDVIGGLLASASDRVKIVRITRKGNESTFSLLDNRDIQKIWDDSLLRHSEILSGLFYYSVVICESDSDCKMYSIIKEHVEKTEGRHSETLFTHCGGLSRIPQMAKALAALQIDTRVVVDLDVLSQKAIAEKMFQTLGGNWNDVAEAYNTLANALPNPQGTRKEEFSQEVNAIVDACEDEYLPDEVLKAVAKLAKKKSKWSTVKEKGVSAWTTPECKEAFFVLDSAFRARGIYLVPEGELECFIRLEDAPNCHGPAWVNKVLERFSNLNDDHYEGLRNFVTGWEC